jgi:uncharacterized iron-regulated protein
MREGKRKTPPWIIALAASLCLACPATHAGKVLFDTRTGERITLSKLVGEVKGARVIVFGESHDDPDDHAAQRTFLQALNDSGASVAVGLEMFRADAQPELDAWIRGKMSEEDFAGVFARNWDADLFPLYRDLLYYARQEGIPLVGLNIDRDLTAKVYRTGFDSLSAEEKKRLGNVACDISDQYKNLLERALGPKKPPPQQFTRFCEAQVLWDLSMASRAVRYLRENPDRTMVVLAGTYHAWKHGIPEQISRLSDLPVRVILPAGDRGFENYKLIADGADYVWRTE